MKQLIKITSPPSKPSTTCSIVREQCYLEHTPPSIAQTLIFLSSENALLKEVAQYIQYTKSYEIFSLALSNVAGEEEL